MRNKIKGYFGILIGFAVLYGAIIACGGSKDHSSSSNKVYKMKDGAVTEKFAILVTNVQSRSRVGGRFINEKAPPGAVFVIVKARFKNISKKPISSFSQPSLKLISPDGVEYETAAGASAAYATEYKNTKKSFSDLNPGITVFDADVFEVAQGEWKKSGWKVLVDADEDIYFEVK